jgi:hypothetical protein
MSRVPPLPLLGQRDGLSPHSPGPKILAEFVVGGAEVCGGLEDPEAAHRIIPLLDAAVIRLDGVVAIPPFAASNR